MSNLFNPLIGATSNNPFGVNTQVVNALVMQSLFNTNPAIKSPTPRAAEIVSTLLMSPGGEESNNLAALRAQHHRVGPRQYLPLVDDNEEYDPCGQAANSSASSGYVPSSVMTASSSTLNFDETMASSSAADYNSPQNDDDKSDTSSVSDLKEPRVFQTNWDEYDSYRCGTPDLEELRLAIKDAKMTRAELDQIEKEKKEVHKNSVGALLASLRAEADAFNNSAPPAKKQRIILDGKGRILEGGSFREPSKATIRNMMPELAAVAATMTDVELPPAPPHPTDPEEIRKLVRSKMPRCKVCRTRFGERNLLERHLRDFHHVEYLEYIAAQEEEIQLQKLEEAELNRIEELQSGGFIPPEADGSFNMASLGLPGERTNGIVTGRFDINGRLIPPKGKGFRKKISPQCNFCDKRFRNEVSLKKHLVKKHPDSMEFVQCRDCFKCLDRAEDLEDHECDLTFMCYECIPMRNLCTATRLLLHRAKFHRGANSGFRCNECNLKFLTPRKLRKHKKMAHVFTKTYQCHFCEDHFTSEISVITHERIHTGIIKFDCTICDFRCNRYMEMETHKKEEHGYLCSICRKPFAEWSEIKDHTLREHSGYLTKESDASQSGMRQRDRESRDHA